MNKFVLFSAADLADDVTAMFAAEDIKGVLGQLVGWATDFIIKLLIVFIIWKLGKFVMKWVIKFVDKALEHAGIEESVVKFINSIVKVGVYAVIAIIILDVLGIQTASLIAVFGSAALAVSMSLQGSLSNFAGGILILVFKPFRLGDYIVANGLEGTVISIEMLYTKLRTVDNKIIMMPNGVLSNSNIINVGVEGIRRLDVNVGISYGSDIAKAKTLLRNVLENYPTVFKDKEIVVIVKELDSSCVTLETRVWVKQDDYFDTKFELLELYKKTLDGNGIEIPFNQLDVHIKQD
ncbi:MAG: mechanosensitive ion channel [Lachnospira sp.]|nr:mechanosensitive ion channel [Lachnospira sp.]